MPQIQTISFEIIRITWSKSISFNVESEFPIPKGGKHKYFVYQIYGNHPIYGRDVLLYIGKTKRFPDRMGDHAKGKFLRGLELHIRLGRIEDLDSHNDEIGQSQMDKAEALLIASVKPAYNSAGLMNSYNLRSKSPFMLQNLEQRGVLPLECSNIWWSNHNTEQINEDSK